MKQLLNIKKYIYIGLKCNCKGLLIKYICNKYWNNENIINDVRALFLVILSILTEIQNI